ncbi:MAG: ABC-F family ATP-binding cassette domain-containing protein [Deltaproteobacteria bacterium]|nr:ABC-F family ATP-binding cassette domain-containing protein [Deltaproteobacteria bacterium]
MSLLLSCQSVSKAFGAAPLFADLSFGIAAGDRVGLVGPNGCGKSTLLRLLAGLEPPDSGTRAARKLLRLAYVPQDARFDPELSVEDVVTAAVGEEPGDDPAARYARIGATLARVGFPDPRQRAATLSGGWAKRLAIACALVQAPELLLMDEPTNHLDVEGILWLERLLRSDAQAYLVVSHDRYFLENVATRIIELNPCYASGVLDHRGRYSEFLEKKDEVLRGQESYRDSLANRVRREIEWLQRGAKARTRKSSARIEAAAALQVEHASVAARTAARSAQLEFTASERRTKRLLVAEGLAARVGERTLFADLDLTLTPGMRLGVLGPNGSGKSTLLRVLAGELAASAGRVTPAPDLRVVYLSQQREQIDPATTLRRALAPEGDQVVFQDRPVHVAGWARRFLFSGPQLEMPIGRLSGGERARVAIARLMLQPADVLMLDEPTNDLDIPTLEILEENLLALPGALVLVTHDRYLFERVSTTVLALDGNGTAQPFADYAQWEAAQRARDAAATPPVAAARPAQPASAAKKRTYKEQRELSRIEADIAGAEAAVAACRAAIDDPAVAADAAALQQRYAELQAAEARVEHLYARWAELEG